MFIGLFFLVVSSLLQHRTAGASTCFVKLNKVNSGPSKFF